MHLLSKILNTKKCRRYRYYIDSPDVFLPYFLFYSKLYLLCQKLCAYIGWISNYGVNYFNAKFFDDAKVSDVTAGF
jgi:hypothetical protein